MYNPIKKMIEEKKEYKLMMKRVDNMPEDYRFVYKKITEYMWNYATGMSRDMLQVHYELIDLFEEGIADGKEVLEVTGRDVAAFADALLENARTYTEDWKKKLNQSVAKKIGGTTNERKNKRFL